MDRRAFIAGVPATLLAASRIARAQPAGLPVLGFLNSQSPEGFAHLVQAFLGGLAEGGYTDGQNVHIDYRWARGRYEDLPALAAELVAAEVDMIFAGGGNPSALGARGATAEIPIVFVMGGDPIALGLAASLSRPGGNVIGVAVQTGILDQKRLELLHGLLPEVSLVHVLFNPTFVNEGTNPEYLTAGAALLGLELRVHAATNEGEIDAAFAAMIAAGAEAILIGTDPYFYSRREQVIALAERAAVPTVYTQAEYVQLGGLISYSARLIDAYRQAGLYVARVLDGEDPAEMPIVQDTRFELAINLHTASALGIVIPQDLIVTATQIIE